MTTQNKQPKNNKLRNAEYYNTQETQDKLYMQSKNGKIFKNLIDLIITDENIMLAYRNIKKNKGSKTAGVDNLTIKDIENWSTEQFIKHIRKKFQWYQPKAVRRVEIPKPNGKTRPLGIPTIIDRIIQQCILQILEPICEAKFHERNNGFRPCRSAEHAFAQMYKYTQVSNMHYVIDIDIKSFFDNVNHGKLIKQMWTLGIRDKKLICIISSMLKAEIANIGFPEKGTPQGGILSPLLSNIVLNELDWWIASQWEEFPIKKHYSSTKGNTEKYKRLRKTNLKECYIIRYADDFKIICRTKEQADKMFMATKKWLKDRLKLDISEEKSKIVNLKKEYSEFLGLKIKVHPKGKKRNKTDTKYVVKSNITDKAKKKITDELLKQIIQIQKAGNEHTLYENINKYNSYIMGIHNYYNKATHSVIDFDNIAFVVNKSIKSRLGQIIKKPEEKVIPSYIPEQYRKSKQMRFIGRMAILPIGYIKHKQPMYKKTSINKYTPEGRKEIHKELESINPYILLYIMRNYISNRSIEYNDNRIAVYVAQKGKCAVTKENLEIGKMHCHHIKPLQYGGNDKYNNLIFVNDNIHKLLHAKNDETIKYYISKTKIDDENIKKINQLRENLKLQPINF